MDDDLQVRLLGGVTVERGGVVTTQASEGRRTALALLALEPAGVDKDVLVAELWPGLTGPKDPYATLYTLLTRVREWLGGPETITASVGVYTLHLTDEQVDLTRFDRHVTSALDPATTPSQVLVDADAALTLWGGVPFAGLDAPRLVAARARAQERRVRLTEARVRALLALDRAPEAVDAVVPLAAEHPERETLHAVLVEALHRAGRPREAVEAYLAARRHLLDELAVEPGEELRAAYRALLDERRGIPTETTPAAKPLMVGREGPLATVVDALGEGAAGRVVVVEGEAGIGKSVLLAAARHAAAEQGATTLSGVWDEDGSPMAAWFATLGRPPAGQRSSPVAWVGERLATLARDAPLLIALDDAHRADSVSLHALATVARSGVPAGVVVLVAARAPDAVAHLDWAGARAELVASRRPATSRWPSSSPTPSASSLADGSRTSGPRRRCGSPSSSCTAPAAIRCTQRPCSTSSPRSPTRPPRPTPPAASPTGCGRSSSTSSPACPPAPGRLSKPSRCCGRSTSPRSRVSWSGACSTSPTTCVRRSTRASRSPAPTGSWCATS